MNCFDVYRVLYHAIDSYMESILLKEDPTDNERKEYEDLKFYLRSIEPNDRIEKVMKTLYFQSNTEVEEEKDEQKE